ncbi:two-component system, response regulator YesN [Alkalispirochaeta americana]|uniref:Two-component system, response regulator YesN n=1 Tax=Alkalispirochaeta americana TaxID=159291 RepID=A0A1N6SDU5_9SPIO|nr:helix-turn-helix domain-containing protein [Alkalispirochaeta americana]SIQ39220.1 two-component system, response regulator YesN [Alkalispirochaeta americana]
MYSVLVVDDEAPVLESYSYMISQRNEEFLLCGAVQSGAEALALAQKTPPDIVVMDIAMPGIDGLDTIREMQRLLPESVYILSTAYERFDLAQRAIPLHVFAYLVKPVSKKTFLQTLEDARAHLEVRSHSLEQRLEAVQISAEALAREEQNFLLLLTWKSIDRTQWEKYKQLFRFQSDSGYVLAVRFGNRIGGGGERQRPGRNELLRVAGKFERRCRCLWTEYTGLFLLFVPECAGQGSSEGYLRKILQEELPPETGFQVGRGSVQPFDRLFISCDEARRGCLQDEGGINDSFVVQDQELRKLRRMAARAHSLDDIYHQACRCWDQEFSLFPFPLAKARLVGFFTLLLDDLERRVGNQEAARQAGDPAEQILSIETRQEWDAWAARTLGLIITLGRDASLQNLPQPLQRAVQYINAEYARPLHLAQLAELSGVSTGHLSRLFSEWLGTTFNDYLNRCRLTAAEGLLRENRLSVKEIAFTVGYQDPNYFGRTFKRYKGVSPSAYGSSGGTI